MDDKNHTTVIVGKLVVYLWTSKPLGGCRSNFKIPKFCLYLLEFFVAFIQRTHSMRELLIKFTLSQDPDQSYSGRQSGNLVVTERFRDTYECWLFLFQGKSSLLRVWQSYMTINDFPDEVFIVLTGSYPSSLIHKIIGCNET